MTDIPPLSSAGSNDRGSPSPSSPGIDGKDNATLASPSGDGKGKKGRGRKVVDSKETVPCTTIPGIRYCGNFVKDMDSSVARMAGCFKLPSTIEVWELYLKDKSTRPFVEQYIAERKVAFGWADFGTSQTGPKEQFMGKVFTDQTYLSVVLSPAKPTRKSIGAAKGNWYGLCTAWHAIRLMKAAPGLFPHSHFIPTVKLNPYDCLHAWKLLNLFWGKVNRNQVPKGALKNAGDPSLPVFHTEPAAAPVARAPTKGGPSFEKTFGMTLDELCDNLEEDSDDIMAPEDLSEQRYLDATKIIRDAVGNFDKAMNAASTKNIRRAPIEYGERQVLMTALYQHAGNFRKHGILYEPADTNVTGVNQVGAISRRATDLADAHTLANPAQPLGSQRLDLGDLIETRETLEYVKRNSAKAPDYLDAAQMIGVDATEPVVEMNDDLKTVLKPWQVTGVSWMLKQEAGPVKGGILADGCGLGKTLQALTLIASAAKQLGKDAQPYRPTLILCPAGLVDTWFLEISTRFGTLLPVRIFHRDREHTSDERRKELVINTVDELNRFCSQLKADDLDTAKTIILSSYSTWSKRTTRELVSDKGDKGAAARKVDKRLAGREILENLQEEGDDDTDSEKAKSRRAKFESLVRGLFARVICDEGHALKTIATRFHQSVADLGADHLWILSATPMFNRAQDMCGYLSLLYREEFDADDEDSRLADPITEYKQGMKDLDSGAPPPTHLLAPRRFASLARKGMLSAADGYDSIPVIMRMLCLGRDADDPLPGGTEGSTIGDDIPPVRVMTVEVRYDPRSQMEHDRFYAPLVRLLRGRKEGDAGMDPEALESGGKIDMGVLRWTMLLSFTPRLYHFAVKMGRKGSLSKAMADRVAGRRDLGFSVFYSKVSKDRWGTVPDTRAKVGWYLAGDCPRLKYLTKLFQDEKLFDVPADGEDRPPRFLIFCRVPLTMWYVRMFLDAMGMEVVTIEATQTAEERAAAAAHFNSPASGCQALLTTFGCGSLGLNLHQACHRTVILETPPNTNTLIQSIGRTHRVGQTHPQKVWILFQDHTVQRYQEYNNLMKYLPQAVGNIPEEEVRTEVQAELERHASVEKETEAPRESADTDDEDQETTVRDEVIETKGLRLVDKLFGQTRSRITMGDPSDLGYKTDDPVEWQLRKMWGKHLEEASKQKNPCRTPSKPTASTNTIGETPGKGLGQAEQPESPAKVVAKKKTASGNSGSAPAGSSHRKTGDQPKPAVEISASGDGTAILGDHGKEAGDKIHHGGTERNGDGQVETTSQGKFMASEDENQLWEGAESRWGSPIAGLMRDEMDVEHDLPNMEGDRKRSNNGAGEDRGDPKRLKRDSGEGEEFHADDQDLDLE
ncbi:P-loop containing nucleoside triphosphate hydrolase protein [Aspergillus falconensis]